MQKRLYHISIKCRHPLCSFDQIIQTNITISPQVTHSTFFKVNPFSPLSKYGPSPSVSAGVPTILTGRSVLAAILKQAIMKFSIIASIVSLVSGAVAAPALDLAGVTSGLLGGGSSPLGGLGGRDAPSESINNLRPLDLTATKPLSGQLKNAIPDGDVTKDLGVVTAGL